MPRAAATFADGVHQAAALLTYLCSGLRFFHHGQLGGWDQKIQIYLCRGPEQPNDSTIQEFYRKLLDFLSLSVVRNGSWQLLNCTAACDGNPTAEDMIAFAWQASDGARSFTGCRQLRVATRSVLRQAAFSGFGRAAAPARRPSGYPPVMSAKEAVSL
jgi:hypothetical protein